MGNHRRGGGGRAARRKRPACRARMVEGHDWPIGPAPCSSFSSNGAPMGPQRYRAPATHPSCLFLTKTVGPSHWWLQPPALQPSCSCVMAWTNGEKPHMECYHPALVPLAARADSTMETAVLSFFIKLLSPARFQAELGLSPPSFSSVHQLDRVCKTSELRRASHPVVFSPPFFPCLLSSFLTPTKDAERHIAAYPPPTRRIFFYTV